MALNFILTVTILLFYLFLKIPKSHHLSFPGYIFIFIKNNQTDKRNKKKEKANKKEANKDSKSSSRNMRMTKTGCTFWHTQIFYPRTEIVRDLFW